MKLINRSEPFELTFDGETYDIPSGEFIVPEPLSYFVIKTAIKWGKDVVSIEEVPTVTVTAKAKVEKIVKKEEEVKKEEVKEEEVGEIEKVEKKAQKSKPKKK